MESEKRAVDCRTVILQEIRRKVLGKRERDAKSKGKVIQWAAKGGRSNEEEMGGNEGRESTLGNNKPHFAERNDENGERRAQYYLKAGKKSARRKIMKSTRGKP